MSTANVKFVMRFRGRLFGNGTPLGLVRDAEFMPNFRTKEVLAEEFGNTPVEVIYCGERAIFLAVLRTWDADAIGKFFPNVLGADKVTYQPNGSIRPGKLLSDKAFNLTYVPDVTGAAFPSLRIFKAVPYPDAAAKLQMSLAQEAGMAIAAIGIPDGSGKVYEIGIT